MRNNLNFLIEISKLKEIPRTGWVLRKVKDPETIADHTFRMAIATWLLGKKKNLDIEKAIKIAFSHDFCEVYAGDITPFFYYIDFLPKEKKERETFLRKYVRLFKEEKEKRGKKKFELEKKSLLKLIKFLEPRLKKEIFSSWINYERELSKEGKFVKQVDKIETLIQAIEYFGIKINSKASSWWEESEEIVDDPFLFKLLKVIQKNFYGKVKGIYQKNKELENIFNFLLEVGKLKRMPRLYWKLRGVKNPETVAGHIFTLTLMAWIYGRKKRGINMGKLIKMALCHELSAVYTGDTTQYDRILPKEKKGREKILKKMLRLSKEKKEWIFLEDYKEEKTAFQKLTTKLTPSFKKEIIQLWEEYRKRSSPEGYFLSQLNVLAVLLQTILYEKKDKRLSAAPIWEWAFEICDDPVCFDLMGEMKKKFY